jgi:hypothetical protein
MSEKASLKLEERRGTNISFELHEWIESLVSSARRPPVRDVLKEKGKLQKNRYKLWSLCRPINWFICTPPYSNQSEIGYSTKFHDFHILWWSFISVDKSLLFIDVDLKIHTFPRWTIDLHTLTRWFIQSHADDQLLLRRCCWISSACRSVMFRNHFQWVCVCVPQYQYLAALFVTYSAYTKHIPGIFLVYTKNMYVCMYMCVYQEYTCYIPDICQVYYNLMGSMWTCKVPCERKAAWNGILGDIPGICLYLVRFGICTLYVLVYARYIYLSYTWHMTSYNDDICRKAAFYIYCYSLVPHIRYFTCLNRNVTGSKM